MPSHVSLRYLYLQSIMPRNKNYNLSFGLFRSFPGRTWPRDPFQRVRLKKWCRTHLKLAPETDYKVISWPFPGLGQKKLKSKMTECSQVSVLSIRLHTGVALVGGHITAGNPRLIESGRPREPGKAFRKVEGRSPPHF